MPESAAKRTQCQHIGVRTANVVCSVRAHDGLDQRPGAESAGRKRSHLGRIAGVDGSGYRGRDVRLDGVEHGEGGHLRMKFGFLACRIGELEERGGRGGFTNRSQYCKGPW